MRKTVRFGPLRIDLQLLDPVAGSGLGARRFTAFATKTGLESTDVPGLKPDPSERVVTADCKNCPGIDLPAVGVAADAIAADTLSVYGEVAEGSRDGQR